MRSPRKSLREFNRLHVSFSTEIILDAINISKHDAF
jgi:hypothetical protein